MKFANLLQSVGNTPHIALGRLFPRAQVWIKDERRNPSGSLKDRVALGMIEAAERNGVLKPGGLIVEPTSGNTGLGLAMVAAAKGYRLVLTMPESMSLERQRLLRIYGARLVLTPAAQGMDGAIARARQIAETQDNAWMPSQFDNPANPLAHQRTADEIIADFPEGFDYFVSGVGTGGHVSGIGAALKAVFPSIKIVAVEPKKSPVLSGRPSQLHGIQGIGAGFVPVNFNRTVIDQIMPIADEAAFDFTRRCVRAEGLLVGISTGANLAAVEQIVHRGPSNLRILTIACDSGERYQSIENLWN